MREIKNTLAADGLIPKDDPKNQMAAPFEQAGAGYIPSKPLNVAGVANDIAKGVATPDDKANKAIQSATKGRASDVGDPFLAMEGIVNGDPVGMETFDLGFYDDGTPAISINGSPIPVDQSMWMALMESRLSTRQELERRMKHQEKVTQVSDTLSTLFKAMPKIPQDTQSVLNAMVEQYPEWVESQIDRIPVNMEVDGGLTHRVQLSAEYQNYTGKQWTNAKTSQRKQSVPLNERVARGIPIDQSEVVIPSIMDDAYATAMSAGDPTMASAIRASAWFAQIGAQHRLSAANQGMPDAGIFDLCLQTDGNPSEGNSMLEQLMLAASNQNLNGQDVVPLPSKPFANHAQATTYINQLQQWANRNWGYSPSSAIAIDNALNYVWQYSNRQRTAVAAPQGMPAPAQSAQPAAVQNGGPSTTQEPKRRTSGISN